MSKIHPYLPGATDGLKRIREEQEEHIVRMMSEPTKAILQASTMDSGKAQPLDSLVLTPRGYMRMGDVHIGQEVVSPDGSTQRVSGVFPQGVRDVYELTLVDGRKVRADGEHLWTVSTFDQRYNKRAPVQRTTKQIMDTLTVKSGDSRWSVEVCEPVDLGEWSSSIDPYLLGLILGDGGITHGSIIFTTADLELLYSAEALLPAGVKAVKASGDYDYRFSQGRVGGKANPLTAELRRLGLMGKGSWDKFVPAELWNVSVADRLSLLQGLLDTDGTPTGGGFEFLSASTGLADAVAWITRSLGGRAKVTPKIVDGRTFQRIYGRLPNRFPPFRLQRHLDKLVPSTKYPMTHLAIKSVELVGQEPVQCIMVDSDLHEYVTDNFVRTHNTLISCEFLVRMGFTRSLIIGVKDTFAQWAKRLALQSDGRIILRRIDSTKAGRQAMADFLAGEDGFFFAGIQYITAQDWVHAPLLDDEGRKVPKIKKTTGEQVTKLSTHIGPRLLPEFETERTHVKVYKKMRVPVQALIVDEVHNYAGRTTIGLRTLRTIPAEWKVGMSGTFYRNKFEGAWSVTSWLWPDLIDTRFSRWVDEHCVVDFPRGKNGKPVTDKRGAPVKQIMGERIPGRFVASLPCYLRIDAERPVPAPELFRVELVAEQREMYRSLEEEGMAWLRAHGVMEPLVTLLPIDKRIRLRQATLGTMTLDQFGRVRFADDTESMKLWALKQIVDRPDWVGRQVLVYMESKQFAFVTAKRMTAAGYRVGVWTGDASSKERDALKEQFLSGQIQYLVAVISSFSTGLDGFQAVCSRVVWLSEDESNTENLQGIKRVFRSGDEAMLDDFQHVKIIANDTYDEGVFLGNTAHAAELAVSMAA